jgi:hypothetical protein
MIMNWHLKVLIYRTVTDANRLLHQAVLILIIYLYYEYF